MGNMCNQDDSIQDNAINSTDPHISISSTKSKSHEQLIRNIPYVPDTRVLSKFYSSNYVTMLYLNYFSIDRIAGCHHNSRILTISLSMLSVMILRGIYVINYVLKYIMSDTMINYMFDQYHNLWICSIPDPRVSISYSKKSSYVYGEFAIIMYKKYLYDMFNLNPHTTYYKLTAVPHDIPLKININFDTTVAANTFLDTFDKNRLKGTHKYCLSDDDIVVMREHMNKLRHNKYYARTFERCKITGYYSGEHYIFGSFIGQDDTKIAFINNGTKDKYREIKIQVTDLIKNDHIKVIYKYDLIVTVSNKDVTKYANDETEYIGCKWDKTFGLIYGGKKLTTFDKVCDKIYYDVFEKSIKLDSANQY